MNHRLIYTFLMICLWTTSIMGQSVNNEASDFVFDKSLINVGAVYHYTKSNIDGSRPIRVSIYQKSQNEIEVYKYEEGYPDASHIVAKMNWETFMPDEISSYVMTRDSTRQTAFMKWEKDLIRVEVHALGHASDTVYPATTPAHMYNFDFTSLNLTFKFLKDPEGEFKIGIVDPTYAESGDDIFYYRGDATLSFERDDHNGKDRKYRLTGRGINFTIGYIWVSKETGMISDMEIPIPDNPGWTSFKFKLEHVQKMTLYEWNKYLRSSF